MNARHINHIMAIAAVSVLIAAAACSPRKKFSFTEGAIWNTTYHITFDGPQHLSDSVRPVLERVGHSLSVFDPQSLVGRLNASDSCRADKALLDTYCLSVDVNRESDGMFDPTLSPLITAWGFGKGHRPTADTLRIDSLLALTGIKRTYLKGGIIYKECRGIHFNFSAVAKGYGCDAVADMFRRNGVENYLVEIGGEIACAGVNASGKKWHISIDRPIDDPEGIRHLSQGTIAVSDCGIATSGNYRNFHDNKSGHYGHTISPLTGRPAKTDVLGATVIAPTAARADAYATSCVAMGSRKAKAMLRRLRIPALLVLNDSSVWTSPGFNELSRQ